MTLPWANGLTMSDVRFWISRVFVMACQLQNVVFGTPLPLCQLPSVCRTLADAAQCQCWSDVPIFPGLEPWVRSRAHCWTFSHYQAIQRKLYLVGHTAEVILGRSYRESLSRTVIQRKSFTEGHTEKVIHGRSYRESFNGKVIQRKS